MRIRIEIEDDGRESIHVIDGVDRAQSARTAEDSEEIEDLDGGFAPQLESATHASSREETMDAGSAPHQQADPHHNTLSEEDSPAIDAGPAPQIPGQHAVVLLPDPAASARDVSDNEE